MRLIEKPIVSKDLDKTLVVLNIDSKDAEQIAMMLGGLKVGEDYELTARKEGKRSLNANNYHWALCEKLAKVLNISKYEAHNNLMIHYGTDWRDSNGDRMYVLMKDDDRYLKAQTIHYRPTDRTKDANNGDIYRWFVLLLPSHLMNTKEMSELIDGTVSECKEVGIETMTPDEIERMKALWGTQA